MYFCRRGLAGNIITSWSHRFNSISSTSFSTALSYSDSGSSTLQTHIVPNCIASSQSHVGTEHAACFCTHAIHAPFSHFQAFRPGCSLGPYRSNWSASFFLFHSFYSRCCIITIISEHLPCSKHCARCFPHDLLFEILLRLSCGRGHSLRVKDDRGSGVICSPVPCCFQSLDISTMWSELY